MSLIEQIDRTRIPRHVAIIMDGNGRWAKQRGMIRSFGHENGVPTVHNITEVANDLGIEFLTLYTFSTENWSRPQLEVDALMHLVVSSIEKETPELIEKNVKLSAIGDMQRMPEFARTRLQKCMSDTAHCTGLEAHMPNPDLLIRTAGDIRVSNYLLWQIAYSELYFTPVLWPDFSQDDFLEAIIEYQRRERRYGKTSEQVTNDKE